MTRKKQESAIDSLRDGTTSNSGTAPTTIAGDAYVVYFGLCGPEQTFAAQGPCITIMEGVEPLVLHPGLNIRPAAQWNAFHTHGPIAARIDDDQIVITDASLRGFGSQSKLRKLAEATEDPDALERLLDLETAKPVNGKRGDTRDSKLMALLEHKLARAIRMPRIDVHDIERVAGAQAAIAPAA